jgi:glycosyltransferase involved in cell wall biosynthesis
VSALIEVEDSVSPIRVLHVLPDLARGGGQGTVLELVRASDRSLVTFEVAALGLPDDLGDAFTREGILPVILDHRPGRLPVTVAKLTRLVRRRRVDVLHVHSGPDRKIGQTAALLTGTPVVSHLHSAWKHQGVMLPDDATALRRLVGQVRGRGRDFVERRTVRTHIAVSDEVASFHAAFAHAPIVTVTNGVPVGRFTSLDNGRRAVERAQKLGVDPGAPVLMCVGRLAAGKGQDTLVDMLPDLPGTLVLVGDGEERAALEHRARELGVRDRLTLLGSRDDVPELLALADVFVFASESEGLPLSVLEAMATGLPIVAMSLPGFDRVVVNGENGFVVEQGDTIEFIQRVRTLLENRDVASRIGQVARRTVSDRYDARVTADRVTAIYQTLACGRRAGARNTS